jgi:UPF0755 protein
MKSNTSKSPSQHRKPLPKWLFIVAPIGLIAAASGIGLSWWNGITAPASSDPSAKSIAIQVKPGASSQSVGQELEAKGAIKSQLAWKLYTTIQSKQGKGSPQVGNYEISPSKPLAAVAAQILEGKVVQTGFIVKPGWRITRMAKEFEEKGFFKADDFIAATKEIPREKFPWLPEGISHLEGFLYPETYNAPADQITPKGVITQMLKQFEQVALPEYKKADANTRYSLLEWVSLASVVEKEAQAPAERGIIAGVFTNRLAKKMRLESDPTAEYGLGLKQTEDRPLLVKEIRQPSPYNTYTIAGIPPGPIASPSIGSLQATLNPEQTDKLFFVAKFDGTGTHVFSKTFTEHINATNAIRQQRQSGKSSG